MSRASQEISYLVGKYNVNGIAFLLDNTLKQENHDPSLNANLPFSEDGGNILNFQKDYSYVLAHMAATNSVPFQLTYFNQEQAQ